MDTITAGGWYTGARRQPGPDWKQNGGVNTVEGFVCHSFEGRPFLYSPVFDPNRRASWHFTLYENGALDQHYPLMAQCWHAGPVNNRTIGCELVGFAPERMTPDALATAIMLLLALESFTGRHAVVNPPSYQPGALAIWRHSAVMATACPGSRWEPFETLLMGDNTMGLTPAENAALLMREEIRALAGTLIIGAADPQLWRVQRLHAQLVAKGLLPFDWERPVR